MANPESTPLRQRFLSLFEAFAWTLTLVVLLQFMAWHQSALEHTISQRAMALLKIGGADTVEFGLDCLPGPAVSQEGYSPEQRVETSAECDPRHRSVRLDYEAMGRESRGLQRRSEPTKDLKQVPSWS